MEEGNKYEMSVSWFSVVPPVGSSIYQTLHFVNLNLTNNIQAPFLQGAHGPMVKS